MIKAWHLLPVLDSLLGARVRAVWCSVRRGAACGEPAGSARSVQVCLPSPRRNEIRQPLKPNLAWRILLCAYRRTLALFGNPKVFFDVKIGGAKRQ